MQLQCSYAHGIHFPIFQISCDKLIPEGLWDYALPNYFYNRNETYEGTLLLQMLLLDTQI